jgi:hypothetical protein
VVRLLLCEEAQMNWQLKCMNFATTVGPHCRIGINNSVLLDIQQGHDGFLGNSVLGEYVILVPIVIISNLKITAEK